MVLPGASGSGKSSLTAALVSSGFGYVTDELLLVDLHAETLMVCIGRVPRRELLLEFSDTQVPGLEMAGDVIRGRDRYVASAMGDGQSAAIAAATALRRQHDG